MNLPLGIVKNWWMETSEKLSRLLGKGRRKVTTVQANFLSTIIDHVGRLWSGSQGLWGPAPPVSNPQLPGTKQERMIKRYRVISILLKKKGIEEKGGYNEGGGRRKFLNFIF